MLDSEEAARRLGIKVPTLYAYVSRGLISARKGADGRRVVFDMDEIEERATRLRGARHVEIRVPTISTGVSKLHESGPSYRGVPAASLVGSATYEQVADLLWRAEPGAWSPSAEVLKLIAGMHLPARDRIRLAVVTAGATDPLRADSRPEAIVRSARRLIATAVEALHPDPTVTNGKRRRPSGGHEPLAERLSACLGAQVTPELRRAVSAILIVLADHEIAPSTLAVRVAASARADCYDALLSGLGTVSGPVHGGTADMARHFLEDCGRLGIDGAVADSLRWHGSIPGFGHSDYHDGDPRFSLLVPHFEALASGPVRELLRNLVDRTGAQGLPRPNVNVAVGAIAMATGMASDAGETLFTIARMPGWIAHYMEELASPPRRFRTRTIDATTR